MFKTIARTNSRVYIVREDARGFVSAWFQPINKKTGAPWQSMRRLSGADVTLVTMRDGSSFVLPGVFSDVSDRYPGSTCEAVFADADSVLVSARADARSRGEELTVYDLPRDP